MRNPDLEKVRVTKVLVRDCIDAIVATGVGGRNQFLQSAGSIGAGEETDIARKDSGTTC